MQKSDIHSHSYRRRPAMGLNSFRSFVLAAGAVGAGAALFLTQPFIGPAVAQLKPKSGSVEAPYEHAPVSFADIVDRVKPAVVSISVRSGGKRKVASTEKKKFDGIPGLPKDHPLNDLFKNLPGNGGQLPGGPSPRRMAEGSGFVVSEDGYVVTNNHVIANSSEITVHFDKNTKYEAELVGTDARTDLALLKIKAKTKFKFVSFASTVPRVGDWAVAVGNPFGLGGTVTVGVVSAHGRDIGSGPYDYLQIDAAVNRGNSGGPTFNLKGEVIGVNTAIYSPSGGNVGIAFAVPSKTAAGVIEELKANGTVSRGWLGVKIQNINEDVAASLGLEQAAGALVSDVTSSGPAEAAGLQVQDAIVRVNDLEIADSRDLARKIAGFTPGTTVDVSIWREGQSRVIKVKLGRFPNSEDEIAALERGGPTGSQPLELKKLGLTFAPADEKAKPGNSGVAIASVEDGSDAERKGLKPGDLILEIQGVVVKSQDDVVKGVKRALEKNRPAVLAHVQSGSAKRFVAIQLKKD